jgi:hypothetical protein
VARFETAPVATIKPLGDLTSLAKRPRLPGLCSAFPPRIRDGIVDAGKNSTPTGIIDPGYNKSERATTSVPSVQSVVQ